jgi:hypothetical protein
MLPVNGVGKPCAGEPHARIDGRELETEHEIGHGRREEPFHRKRRDNSGSATYRRSLPPRQLPTLPLLTRGFDRYGAGLSFFCAGALVRVSSLVDGNDEGAALVVMDAISETSKSPVGGEGMV